MKIGDLVRAKLDIQNNFDCLGVVIDKRTTTDERSECYIIWASVSAPTGWWYEHLLEPEKNEVS